MIAKDSVDFIGPNGALSIQVVLEVSEVRNFLRLLKVGFTSPKRHRPFRHLLFQRSIEPRQRIFGPPALGNVAETPHSANGLTIKPLRLRVSFNNPPILEFQDIEAA